MPSLGFSVEHKTGPRRVADLRDIVREEQNDAAFALRMIILGLVFLAVGAFHEQARMLIGRFFVF